MHFLRYNIQYLLMFYPKGAILFFHCLRVRKKKKNGFEEKGNETDALSKNYFVLQNSFNSYLGCWWLAFCTDIECKKDYFSKMQTFVCCMVSQLWHKSGCTCYPKHKLFKTSQIVNIAKIGNLFTNVVHTYLKKNGIPLFHHVMLVRKAYILNLLLLLLVQKIIKDI